MSRAIFDKFFDLPAEIRDGILSYLCYSPEPIYIAPINSDFIPLPHALFLSHPLLYSAASRIFYEQNTFVLDLGAGPRAATERAISAGSSYLLNNTAARRRIRHLELWPGRLGNVFANNVCPALMDMVLNGALRHLRVEINPAGVDMVVFKQASTTPEPLDGRSWHSYATRQDDAYMKSEPFMGLVRLLADPDLETSELLVAPVHRSLWCQFHEGVVCQRMDYKQGDNDMIPIDWRKLAASYGDEHEFNIISFHY